MGKAKTKPSERTIREALAKRATITLKCQPEDEPIKGNASAVDEEGVDGARRMVKAAALTCSALKGE